MPCCGTAACRTWTTPCKAWRAPWSSRRRGRGNPFVPADVDALFRRFFGFSPWDRFVQRRDLFGPPVPRRQGAPSNSLPLSAEARRNATAGRETYETVEGLADYPVRILTKPVLAGGRVRNVIQVGMSQENLYATRRRFLWGMAAVLPLGLLLAAGGGWMLARRALAPVEHMAEAARRISAEHLAERLETSATGDELDRLSGVLNAMLERLGPVVSPDAPVQRRRLARTANTADHFAGRIGSGVA